MSLFSIITKFTQDVKEQNAALTPFITYKIAKWIICRTLFVDSYHDSYPEPYGSRTVVWS